MINTRTYRYIVLIIASILVTACTSKPERTDASRFSGFLDDYSELQEYQDDLGAVLRWANPEIVPLIRSGYYDRIFVADVVFHPEPKISDQVRREVLADIAGYMKNTLQQSMGREILIANGPQRGALRIDTAITGVSIETEGFKVNELIPIRLIFSGVEAALGNRDQVVQIYIETRVSDARTGEVLARIVRKGFGETLSSSDQALTLETVSPIIDQWSAHFQNVIRQLKQGTTRR